MNTKSKGEGASSLVRYEKMECDKHSISLVLFAYCTHVDFV